MAFAEALAMDSLAQYESQWGWLLTTILAIGASLDLVIAATLVFYLTQQRSGAYKRSVYKTILEHVSSPMAHLQHGKYHRQVDCLDNRSVLHD